MHWLKIELPASAGSVDDLSEALAQCGAFAVSIEGNDTNAVFEGQSHSPNFWRRSRVSGLFQADVDVATIVKQLEQYTGSAVEYRVERVQDRPWQSAWRESCKPMRFGKRLWICPAGLVPSATTGAVTVLIDPGLAFGTGTHATTALCLEWIAAHAHEGKTVIDYGCGSGILAIAALKLDAKFAWGVDIDHRALEVSADNARRNGVSERYHALTPQALPGEVSADIVFANILARPLMELAPDLRRLVRADGLLLLSGFLADQVETVHRHYAAAFSLETRFREDSDHEHCWAMLIGHRKGAGIR
jgi:ribosomal protein L11 methyltransferase